MLHGSGVSGIFVGSVIVSVPAGVQDTGEGLQRGVGDLGEHGGLPAGLVPQDLQVEGLEQVGFQLRGQARQDVPGQRELLQQGRVGGLRSRRGQGGQLGLELLAFGVELGEPGADPAAQRGGRGAGGVGGEFFQFQDAGVLAGLDPLEPGLEGGGPGVAFGGGGRVGGGELGGEQGGAAGAEDVLGEEQAGDLVQAGFGGLDGAGMIRVASRLSGLGRVVRAPVVDEQAGAAGLGQAGHAAAAVPAPAAAPVGVDPGRGRMSGQAGPVPAGAVPGADVLGGLPGGPVHDHRMGRLGGPQPLVRRDGQAAAVALADPPVDHVPGVLGVAQQRADALGGPPDPAGGGVAARVGVQPRRDGGHAELVHDPPGEDLRHDRGAFGVQDQAGLGAALAGLDRDRVRDPSARYP